MRKNACSIHVRRPLGLPHGSARQQRVPASISTKRHSSSSEKVNSRGRVRQSSLKASARLDYGSFQASVHRLHSNQLPPTPQDIKKRRNLPHSLFKRMVSAELLSVSDITMRETAKAQFGICTKEDAQFFEKWVSKTEADIKSWEEARMSPGKGLFQSKLQKSLWKAYLEGDKPRIGMQLKYLFQDTMANRGFDTREMKRQNLIGDLRYPAEWFPDARRMEREIHLHIGPTNSGKTYHALEKLRKAEKGVYAGPLRLLAHEVHSRMVAAGRSCNMITGDERIISDDPNCGLVSCTVEMAPSGIEYDVAVIDEIQMLGDDERGWAWSQAFLNLRAKELHLCGEARSLSIIRQLAAATGDKLVVHEYQRLSPLEVGIESLNGDLNKLQPGDCIVAFTRGDIHEFRSRITKLTGRKVAVVYGSLPAETRAEQARLFNDPNSGYDILVASNAIGMGLNLSIKRIIFAQTIKFNGYFYQDLLTTEVKQIGGRAGRYRTSFQATSLQTAQKALEGPSRHLDLAPPEAKTHKPSDSSTGIVTTLLAEDLAFISGEMDKEPEPLEHAKIRIPDETVMRFASYFPRETPLNYLLCRLRNTVSLSKQFQLGDIEDEIIVANALEVVKNLRLEHRLTFCAAPANLQVGLIRQCLVEMAICVSQSKPADLFSLPIPLGYLQPTIDETVESLKNLENLHACLTLYMWLSYRFVGLFTSQAVAQKARSLTEQRINETLTALAQSGKMKHRWRPPLPPRQEAEPGLQDGSRRSDQNRSGQSLASPLSDSAISAQSH